MGIGSVAPAVVGGWWAAAEISGAAREPLTPHSVGARMGTALRSIEETAPVSRLPSWRPVNKKKLD